MNLYEEKHKKPKKPNFTPDQPMTISAKLYYEGKSEKDTITSEGKANRELETILDKLETDNQIPSHPSPLMDSLLKTLYYVKKARNQCTINIIDNKIINKESEYKLYTYDEIRHSINDLISLCMKYNAY